jgi:tetratricopeptide (TPR) repeat protein
LTLTFLTGCAYYNIFFNAEESFKKARESHKKNEGQKLSQEAKKNYNTAIEKSWKLLDWYGDSSDYADDALVMIGKCYYFTEDFIKAERVLQQFQLNYSASILIPQSKLWLARVYINLEKFDSAIEEISSLLEDETSKELSAQANKILGDLYIRKENYQSAIPYLQTTVNLSDTEEMKGEAWYQLGLIYYKLENYSKSLDAFQKLTELDIPVIREFEARIKMVDIYLLTDQIQKAEESLKLALKDQRFSEQFSVIESKLASAYEFMGDPDFAMEHYYDVLGKYPGKEGSKIAAYHMAQLYENTYGQFDSALVYYQRVGAKKTAKNNEQGGEAAENIYLIAHKKSKLLAEYSKIRKQLDKDILDIYLLSHGDSLITDSVEVKTEYDTTHAIEAGKLTSLTEQADEDSTLKTVKKQTQKKKKSITRNQEQIEESYLKNSYALAEYFLLKYQNYDSAATAYTFFCNHFDDSLLLPKSYYSLYYILDNEFQDKIVADSIKNIILEKYPTSEYAFYLQGNGSFTKKTPSPKDKYKELFLAAENDLVENQFHMAISKFRTISQADSGSTWAMKSLFNIAHIYEKKLKNIDEAIKYYKIIIDEYPTTQFGKIAKNKTKIPEKLAVQDSTIMEDSLDIKLEKTPIESLRKVDEIEPLFKDKEREIPKNKEKLMERF